MPESFRSETTVVITSRDGFLWGVYRAQSKDIRPLAAGRADSFGMAFRAARNWLRNNQNAVYGQVGQEMAQAA